MALNKVYNLNTYINKILMIGLHIKLDYLRILALFIKVGNKGSN